MPLGPEPLGYAYFAGVKLLGYTAAASYLNRRIPGTTASPWLVGAVRTVIGMGAGLGAVYLATHFNIPKLERAWYALLVPIRICEWLILLGLFYRRPTWNWSRSFKFALLGTAWSYVLDLPAILAVFAIPGGAWIC